MVPLFGLWLCDLRLSAGAARVGVGEAGSRGSLREHQYPLGIKLPCTRFDPFEKVFLFGPTFTCPLPRPPPPPPPPLSLRSIDQPLPLFMLNSWLVTAQLSREGYWMERKAPAREYLGSCGRKWRLGRFDSPLLSLSLPLLFPPSFSVSLCGETCKHRACRDVGYSAMVVSVCVWSTITSETVTGS
jgi:hypothetical protein